MAESLRWVMLLQSLRDRSVAHLGRCPVVLLVLFALCYASVANAGSVRTVSGAMPGFEGSTKFSQTSSFGSTLSVNVDYAVFAPGNFDSSVFGGDGDFRFSASDYVYAYQAFNNSAPVSDGGLGLLVLSIGFDPILYNPLTHVSPIKTVGQTNSGLSQAVAYSSYYGENDATAFIFSGNNGLAPSEQSYIILESSHDSPVFDGQLGYGSYLVGGGVGPIKYLASPNTYVPIGSVNGGIGPPAVPLPKSWIQILTTLAMVSMFWLIAAALKRPAI